MKANYYTKFALLILSTLIISTPIFSSNNIKEVFANQNFQISNNDDVIDIAINKNPWESFTLAIDNMELINNPMVSFDINSSEAISMRVDLTDGFFMSSELNIIKKEITESGSFTTLTFDFTEMIHEIDLSENVYLVFYVNPGQAFAGSISIKNITLSPETEDQKSINSPAPHGFKIFPSPATTFTNVEIPNAWFSTLKIVDMRGNEVYSKDVTMLAGTSYRIDLNNFAKGYYTVQLSDGETVISEKLIIN